MPWCRIAHAMNVKYMSLWNKCQWTWKNVSLWNIRPRMEKSHSFGPRTVWFVVNMFHKHGMRPLIIANGTKCYSILYCNSPWLYIRLKYTYSVISVKVDSLPGNSTKWGIDLFVAFAVRLVHSWADVIMSLWDIYHCETYFIVKYVSLWNDILKNVYGMMTYTYAMIYCTPLMQSHILQCGVASISRIDKIIGLFCKRAL